MCFISVGNRMKAIVIKASYEHAPLSFSADISKNHFRQNKTNVKYSRKQVNL